MKLNNFKKTHSDFYLILSLLVFLCLILPFSGVIPYLDGNIDFVKSYDFFSGGFEKLFQNWTSIHPPVKEFVVSLFFAIFSINSYSYTIIGSVFGVLGIVLFYSLISKLSDKKIAGIGIFILATNPLFISVGIFSLTDYILAIFIIGSFYFYLEKRYMLLLLFLNFSVLTKETGFLLPASMMLAEIILIKKTFSLKKSGNILTLLILTTPFLTTYFWHIFLESQGKPLWSEWNFSTTANRGSIYTIIHNLTSFSFLNKYAYQNWLHLFILNFNWIYWLVFFIGILITPKKTLVHNLILAFSKPTQKDKVILSSTIFFLLYILTVLSFQTYTIPRYILPLIPFLIIAFSKSVQIIIERLKIKFNLILIPILLLNVISLFFSVDPISTKIWGREKIFGENIYSLRRHFAGSDGITYNMQYATIVKKRTNEILKANIANIIFSEDCSWLFPDPNNDNKTMKILKLNINPRTPCSNIR